MASSSKDYKNGRIYKILNYIDSECYVGSTCQPLSKRMATHRKDSKRDKNGHRLLYAKMNTYGVENFYIELLEEYPCQNVEQLHQREGYYIRMVGTLNKNIQGQTPRGYRENNRERRREYENANKEVFRERKKEYDELHKEKILGRKKEYYVRNKDDLCAKKRETYRCICGSIICVGVKAKHERTHKHKTRIESLEGSSQH